MEKHISRSARFPQSNGSEKRMEVVCSCGKKIGEVDHLEHHSLTLAGDSCPDGKAHQVPLQWVDHVNSQIHLTKTCDDAMRSWQNA